MRKASMLVVILSVLFVASGMAWAAMDIFLKIDGIPGESLDMKHTGEIDVHSWSFGMTNQGTTQGVPGRVEMKHLVIVKSIDRATPKLFQAATMGNHINQATLTIRPNAFSNDNFQLKLFDILVTGFDLAGGSDASGTVNNEQISLSFNKVEMTYIYTNPSTGKTAAIVANWDLLLNSAY